MIVKALKTFVYVNLEVSMHEGQIADIDDEIAGEMIAEGFVEESEKEG